jgi:hypothetical protein
MSTAEFVTVRRNWGDHRKLSIPLEHTRNPHMTDHRGGDYARLPLPTLAVYASCEWIPDGSDFPHSRKHGCPWLAEAPRSPRRQRPDRVRAAPGEGDAPEPDGPAAPCPPDAQAAGGAGRTLGVSHARTRRRTPMPFRAPLSASAALT